MIPKQIDLTEAMRAYNELKSGAKIDWNKIESSVLSEDASLPNLDVDSLVRQLDKLKRQYPQELRQKTSDGTAFDAEAAVIIHKWSELEDFLAARQEFWAWLSLKYFWALINWRHQGKAEFAIPENFSVTKRRHGLLERLWFRAELGRVEGDDPYKFVLSATDRDFWESGIIRPSYSSCRPIATAFVRYQFQNSRGYLHLTDPGGVRQLYKRISRIYATVALDVLSEAEASGLIADLADGLAKSGRDTQARRESLKP